MNRPAARCLILALLAVSSCTGPGSSSHHVLGVVKLGADLSLSGDDAQDGIPVQHAIELAIKQAGLVCGAASHQDACVQLQSVIDDDVNKGIHDAAQGVKNVQHFAADVGVVGMIGPLYDGVARSELPVANAVHLAMVSPAVTDECLTQEPPDGHCHGQAARLQPKGPNNFFRVVTTQLVEGTAGADLAYKLLGKRRAFIVNDQTALGQNLAGAFSERFTGDGGMIVDPSDLGAFDPNQPPDFGLRVERARELASDVVYFAGSAINAAAALRREMAVQTPSVPLIGSDRLANSQFAKSAGGSVRGSYYTVVGPYPPTTRPAATFIRDYRKAYGQEVGVFSLPAFDATNIVIRAIARAIDDLGGKLPDRAHVLAEVSRTSEYRGAMGVMSFGPRGDTSLKLITAYQWLAAGEPSGQYVAQNSVE